MLNFPMTFETKAESGSGVDTTWTAGTKDHSITMAIPPEFQGKGGGFSPEDIYAMALSNCFVATFKVVAEKSRLSFDKLDVNAKLIVDRGDGGRPWMSKINLKVNLVGATDADRALQLLKKTSESCMILNSVKTEKSFEFQIT